MGDAARRRTQAHHAAERGRRPQGATQVRAVGQPGHPGLQRYRGPARGTAAGERSAPRVAGDAEHLVEGVGTGAELGRVGLPQHDPARSLDTLHLPVGRIRHLVREDRRALGGAHARDFDQVLDQHGQPVQETRRCRPAHDPPRMVARPLGAVHGHGVDQRVDRGDPGQGAVDQLERRDLPCAQTPDRLPRRDPGERVHR